VEIKLALDKLNVLASVLMIAAHPDDENTALLAYLARGRNARTAYLSATRGEGGQNLIGAERGEPLGVIRTQELLAARKVDGAEQFFTSAVDFGFSKTAEETISRWGREEIRGEMMRIISQFKPDVVILRFSGTPSDGHGQHQASAILGREAFAQSQWKARRLLFNTFAFTPEQEREAAAAPGRIEIDTGEFNPLLGKSYSEIAAISRGMHRSQGMGSAERRGPQKNYLTVVEGAKASKDIFEGVDTTWNRVEGGVAVGRILAEASRTFDMAHPEKTVPLLLKARPLVEKVPGPWGPVKLADLDEAIALCSGLWLDAAADRHQVAEGEAVKVTLTAINRSRLPWQWSGAPLAYNEERTQVVYLKPGKAGRFTLESGGAQIRIARTVNYRYVDPVEGELTRPVTVVPVVSVNAPAAAMMFPTAQARTIDLQVTANVAGASGEVRLELPAGWKADPSSRKFQLEKAGDQQAAPFSVTPPAGDSAIRARAVATAGGRNISSGLRVIAYPHIPPQTLTPPAEIRMVRTEVKNLAKEVGYVMGAGDEVPAALRQIGSNVTLLDAAYLAGGPLSRFDAIVAGVRAFNTRPDLRANHQRLLDYVSAGGTAIVQYNVAEGGPFASSSGQPGGALDRIGPWPIQIGRERVTVEEAPVRILKPGHRLMTAPNRISRSDFDGWIQERGLYFPCEWDSRYEAILETNDPGEKPLSGGLLYGRYGKGVYIYTSYVWFRELPAGVPGAYRIFANLLSARE
jgi:LmbE family N-acetylglucosaminyl deacetylase